MASVLHSRCCPGLFAPFQSTPKLGLSPDEPSPLRSPHHLLHPPLIGIDDLRQASSLPSTSLLPFSSLRLPLSRSLSALPYPHAPLCPSPLSFMRSSCTIEPTSRLAFFLSRFDVFCTAIFVSEMLVKVVALGLVATPNAYLKNPWNCLDGFIVSASLLSGSNPVRVPNAVSSCITPYVMQVPALA